MLDYNDCLDDCPDCRGDLASAAMQKAYVDALMLAITAPTAEQSGLAVEMAERIAVNLTPTQAGAGRELAAAMLAPL